MTFPSVCIQQQVSYNEDSLEIVYTIEGIFLLILLFTLIMLSSALFFIKSRSKSNKVPVKFGRYQRNVLTFSQTFFCNLYIDVFFGISLLSMFQNIWKPSIESTFYFTLAYFLIIQVSIPGFVFPSLLLWRLHTKLPELFLRKSQSSSNIRIFYIRDPEIIPYRSKINSENSIIN